MSRFDLDYFRRRLAAERKQAETAQQAEVRRVHRDFAERYSAMIRDNIARG